MSYGIYSEETSTFSIGYDMNDFWSDVLAYSKQHKRIKVYFHNAMNYDANFILRSVLNDPAKKDWSIQMIMKSSNRLQKLSFMYQDRKTKRIIEIGDTYMFMSMSLEKICYCMRTDDVNGNVAQFPRFFKEMTSFYLLPDETVNMILKKNLFPYKFFTDSRKLNTPLLEFEKVFEPREENLKFFSENVSVHDLEVNFPEFRSVCVKFGVTCARDYHDIYLRCDVLQLADMFLSARESLWDTHHVELCEYIGLPAASWAAFLRNDPNLCLPMYNNTIFAEFFKRMTRGGVTSAPLRYACADEHSSILYLDVNGLYPFVMQKFRYPLGDFQWKVYGDEIDTHRKLRDLFAACHRAGDKGFCARVNLHYSPELKEYTDSFPFAPDHVFVNDQYFDESGQLYPFLKEWSRVNGGATMKPFKGLVGTLQDKREYCVHWRLLEWYMDHGLEVSKIHNIVTFSEGDVLKSYPQKNIALRNQYSDEFHKWLFKLMSNAVFGKFLEDPLNHSKYILVRNQTMLDGVIQTENVLSIYPIDENNSIVLLTGDEVELDKLTYLGATITEMAKLHMYYLLYDVFMKMFPKVELVYTDTDSFILKVYHPEEWEGKEVGGQFVLDYINQRYQEEHGETIIGKLGGQIKSETGTDLIQEVVALRSKVYAYKTKEGHVGKRAKGTTAAAQERELDWEAYKEVLITKKAIPTTNLQFLRRSFTITTTELLKTSLSANDGKRIICPDGIHTHAIGY